MRMHGVRVGGGARARISSPPIRGAWSARAGARRSCGSSAPMYKRGRCGRLEATESNDSAGSTSVADLGEAKRNPSRANSPTNRTLRAVVLELGERPDLAAGALRHLRRFVQIDNVPVIVVIGERQIARLDPSTGFDDFLVLPCRAEELYARIRALEWRRSEFASDERSKVGGVVVDRAAHEASLEGRAVSLTAKEFALLAFLAANRGRVFSRETLLARVWGSRYDGGARTVDIHVRRLRAKLGDALPLETLRGAGYKMRAPESHTREREDDDSAPARLVLAPSLARRTS